MENREDAVVFIIDAPPGLDFGIDCMCYETGPNFRGVNVIPSGLHFIYHSMGMGTRQGFFLNLQRGDIYIASWDSVNEEILPTADTISDDTRNNLVSSIRRGQLHSQLGPYPLSQHHMWLNLTALINSRVLGRADINPSTVVHPGDADDLNNLNDSNLHTRKSNKNITTTSIKPYFSNIARIASFSDINKLENELKMKIHRSKDHNMSNLTNFYMDRSTLLSYIIDLCHNHSWEDLLGELQLAFVLFLLLFSYPALSYWKQLVSIICHSESYLLSNSSFTCTFIRTLYEQLSFAPDDFFQPESELTQDNFLKSSLSSLFTILSPGDALQHGIQSGTQMQTETENMVEPTLHSTVLESRKRLLNFVRKKFGLFEETAIVTDHTGMGSGPVYGPGLGLGESGLHRRLQGASWASHDEELYNLVDEDMPVVVFMDIDDVNAENVCPESEREGPHTSGGLGGAEMNEAEARAGADEDFGGEAPYALTASSALCAQFAQRQQQRSELLDRLAPPHSQAASEQGLWADNHSPSTPPPAPADATWMSSNAAPSQTLASPISVTATTTASVADMASTTATIPEESSVLGTRTSTRMSLVELEHAQFNWRYPALFAAMLPGGCEDFTMAATRLLDEAEEQGEPASAVGAVKSSTKNSAVLMEAMLFLTEEVSRRSLQKK